MKSIVMIMGFPGAGKSTYTKSLIEKGYKNFNRDTLGCSLNEFNIKLENEIAKYKLLKKEHDIVIDNTYSTIASRHPVIQIAKRNGYRIECWEMSTTIEEAQVNAVQRQIERHGKLFMPDDFKSIKDDNMFPPAVLFKYKKEYQKPTKAEGFDDVVKVQFKRNPYTYSNKALILDYDGTLRKTISGEKYPTRCDDIAIIPNRAIKIIDYRDKGYKILGVSNQSGVAKGKLSHEMAEKCFQHTNNLLGVDIEFYFCPHAIPPITCFCRKPMPGLGIMLVEKYKLNPAETIFVGDMTTDKTFAARCGFTYIPENEFFS